MKQKLLKNHKNLFKEVLDKTDRINGPPVRLILDPNKKVKPVAHCKPFDVPFNLRKTLDTEISQAVTAGILSPCNEATAWCHQLFPVPKPGRDEVRIVSDFKRLNSAMLRPHFPTELSSQMLRHIEPDAKWFATLDMVSAYHQVSVHPEDRHLLTVICQQGRFQYNTLSQGICSASDLFNYLSDGTVRYDGNWQSIQKNMDDVLFAARNLDELELMLTAFFEFCLRKNIKLKGSKFYISQEFEDFLLLFDFCILLIASMLRLEVF